MRMRVWSLLIALATLVLAWSALAEPVTITGTVVDADGNPVEGARVWLMEAAHMKSPTIPVVTNEEGWFAINSRGRWRVYSSTKQGYRLLDLVVYAQGPLSSAWVDRERGRALIVLSNLATESWDGAVRFDREALGIGAASQPFDAMFDRPLQQNADGSLPLSIEPQRYRLVIFGDRIPLPDNPALDETADTGP